jgi:integrase
MHLSETPTGWRVIVQYDGQRRSAVARSRMEAMMKGSALVMELGGDADLSTMTVGELVADYLNDLTRRASPKYVDEAERAADRIPPAFMDRRASKVSGLHLDALYRQLENDVPTSAIRRIHTVVMAAYNRAVKLGALAAAPQVGKPVAPVPDVKPPSHEQAKAVLAVTEGLDHLALRLAAVTGCRRGEVVAIQWADVDLDRARLHVRRSLVSVKGATTERATKTGRKGHRVIGLDLPTVALLRKHKTSQAAHALASGVSPRWVISDEGAVPWRPDRLTRVFIDARTAAKVDHFRLHDLRHYVATTMLDDGEPVAKVAKQLGHTSITTTTTVYAHWIDHDDDGSADRRASRLG